MDTEKLLPGQSLAGRRAPEGGYRVELRVYELHDDAFMWAFLQWLRTGPVHRFPSGQPIRIEVLVRS